MAFERERGRGRALLQTYPGLAASNGPDTPTLRTVERPPRAMTGEPAPGSASQLRDDVPRMPGGIAARAAVGRDGASAATAVRVAAVSDDGPAPGGAVRATVVRAVLRFHKARFNPKFPLISG